MAKQKIVYWSIVLLILGILFFPNLLTKLATNNSDPSDAEAKCVAFPVAPKYTLATGTCGALHFSSRDGALYLCCEGDSCQHP